VLRGGRLDARVDDVVKAMGIEGISKSAVSEMARSLDALVADFRDRPSTAAPTPMWPSTP